MRLNYIKKIKNVLVAFGFVTIFTSCYRETETWETVEMFTIINSDTVFYKNYELSNDSKKLVLETDNTAILIDVIGADSMEVNFNWRIDDDIFVIEPPAKSDFPTEAYPIIEKNNNIFKLEFRDGDKYVRFWEMKKLNNHQK